MWGLFSTLAAAFVSLFSAANSANNQNRNIDKQLKAQSDENKMIREYNLQLAREQNQMNLDQWNRQNNYNSPSAQMKRLQDAGLNPDMMMGGGISNTSVSSPQMTSGAPASSMDWSSLAGKRSIGDVTSQALQNEMIRAQIDNVKANTKKQGAETDILSTDASFRKAYNRGLLETQNMQINLGNSNIRLNDENIGKVRAEVQKINQECSNLSEQLNLFRAQIANLDADTAYKDVKRAVDKLLADGQIKEMASRVNLSDAQAKQIAEMTPYLVNEAASRNGLQLEQGALLRLQKGLVEIDLSKAQNHYSQLGGVWSSVYSGITFVNDLIGAVSHLVHKL